ncbi:Adenine DNA glycosylase-like protein [Elsinoe fawcettii]|nr:Adenine DNA glycosylase-like protein [Elsinoe fawcettii]
MVKRSSNATARPAKRQKVGSDATSHRCNGTNALSDQIHTRPAIPPSREHHNSYHQPLLVQNETASKDLLQWFDSTSTARNMPWRKPFPTSASLPKDPQARRNLLSKRAYEVWVSEIMLQQTRVSTVIPYFNNWIEKWPTIQALAEANQDDVLAAWKGLGYYSRATRLWKGAQTIMDELGGQVPDTVEGLLKVSGIGPYTAGAVASIAFGRSVPLVDGNVARVLSRQIGLFADMKKKEVDTLIWDTARELVTSATRASSAADEEEDLSDIPGRWNQALMELGSTICTPRPKCSDCPVQSTCRVFSEAQLLTTKPDLSPPTPDIEEACQLCDALPSDLVSAAASGLSLPDTELEKENTAKPAGKKGAKGTKASKGGKQLSLSAFAFSTPKKPIPAVEEKAKEQLEQVTAYCALFPKRAVKKAVPEEDHGVCVFRFMPSQDQEAGVRGMEEEEEGEKVKFLLQQRPDKGLLASMWEFPSFTFGLEEGSELEEEEVLDRAMGLVKGVQRGEMELRGKIGEVTHVFSHLKLRMHVYAVDVVRDETLGVKARQKWVGRKGVEDATVGTGMRRCWEVYKGKRKSLV